ncbi:hypothetical protein GLOIN_2v1790542 [Rhizophagus clarus]|uniref:Uncharacterized protein n=1 Tax=Rhizophagus clarus TaxID=94130 RepID=A0A8H3QMV1_9GLOM|nr:hypothetical protein GLOIN_2v1790542 [Rhizophagus clarus]
MSYETNKDTNDNNEGDNTKGEDDNDNDEIDKANLWLKEDVKDIIFQILAANLRMLKNLQLIKVNNKFWINNINEFYNSGIFLTNDSGKSSQYLLSYILNDDITLEENSAQIAGEDSYT